MVTLSDSTKNAYLKRAESLLKRYAFEVGKKFNSSEALCFENWVSSHVETWSPATRRQYKSALQFYCNENGWFIEPEMLSNIFRCDIQKHEVRRTFGKRTSAMKAKKVNAKVWKTLKANLEKSCSPKAALIINLIEASLLFGLRPVEWAFCDWVSQTDKALGLKVINAKATQGRSFGDSRTVWVSGEPKNFSAEVSHSIACANEVIQHFNSIKEQSIKSIEMTDKNTVTLDLVNAELKACRRLLGQINSRLEKRGLVPVNQRITLYSGRHQCAANAKKANLEPLEIAALMGHGALDTNEKYYGRKTNGKGGFALCADKSDLNAVIERNAKLQVSSKLMGG